MHTLPAVLAQHAETIPDQLFTRILKGGKEIAALNFGQAWQLAGQWAALFAERGITRGDSVVLALPNNDAFVGAYYGCLIAGIAPAPVAPMRRVEADDAYLRTVAERAKFIGAKAVVVSQEQLLVSGYSLLEGIQVLSAGQLEPLQTQTTIQSTPDDLALIQFTSGTLGNPKAVLLTQSALLFQAESLRNHLQLYDRFVEHGVSWLPLYHDMGLIGFLLTPGFAGGEINLMQPEDFVLRPTLWLKAMTEYKATVTGGPPSAFALCAKKVKEADLAQYDLSTLRVALVGAEAVTRESLNAFAERFVPTGFKQQAFMPTYGLAENSLAVTIPPLNTAPTFDIIEASALAEGRAVQSSGGSPASERQFANVGSPLPGVLVRIVNDAGAALPDRQVGEITVQSPSMLKGYSGAIPQPIQNGWLYTGDLGYMADGNLYVTGRKKEVIIVGGRNYYPDDVEQLVSTVDGVRMDRAVAVGLSEAERATEKLVVLAETDRAETGEREALRLTIRVTLTNAGYPVSEVVLLKPKSIQSTLTGKLKRLDCRERYLAGEFEA